MIEGVITPLIMKLHFSHRPPLLAQLFLLLLISLCSVVIYAEDNVRTSSVAASEPPVDSTDTAKITVGTTTVSEPISRPVETPSERPMVISAIVFEGNTLNKSKTLEHKLK